MTTPRSTPLWQSIAATLRAAIAEGQYSAGSRLPSEAELSARFGVNRHTVRHALAQLIDDGLVHSRRGSGTYVLARPLDYRLGQRMSFHQNLRDAGRLPGRRVLSVEVRGASAGDARRLAMDEGAEICVVHSLALADGTPICLAESLYPEARLPGLAAAMRGGLGVSRALTSVGITDFVRVETRMSGAIADAAQAAQLRVREGAALLLAEALNASGGVPVEVGRTWFVSDRVALTLDHGGIPSP
ncbi:MAG: phosphonate metabolism transcriptional regulator PhnF [Pseudomonadota bacterium]